MKRNAIKKLGIIILSSMIVASPVAAPLTTMTVYAADVTMGETVDTNNTTIDSNFGTIGTNEGTVTNNNTGAIINTNENRVTTNFGTIETNEGTVDLNRGTIGTNEDTVVQNMGGTITENNGLVKENIGTIKNNYGEVQENGSTIENNYGTVTTNNITVKNNYTTIDGKGTVGGGGGTVTNQWYEVKLVNNTTDLKIKSEDAGNIKDRNNSGNTDVFAKKATVITIYSTNPNRIIDALEGDIEYVKNDDGSITICSGIQSTYSLSLLTILADKILESAPVNNESDNKEEVVIEITAPVQPQITTPAGAVNATTVVSANPVAAVMAALTLQNDPVVAAQAQALSAHMDTVKAAFKEIVVKELAAAPNQAKVGSTEYAAKQVAIVTDLTNQMTAINSLTVQSLAVIQKTGVSVATGGCTKLEAANVTLLNDILAKGIPVNLTYAVNGKPVTIKIPVGVDLTRFIGADGRLDFAKLRAYVVR